MKGGGDEEKETRERIGREEEKRKRSGRKGRVGGVVQSLSCPLLSLTWLRRS